MARSPDLATRRVRDAANGAAVAVVAFAVLFVVTTQIKDVRAVSPFGEDPYDLFASYAAIFLPLVAGATWIRSLAHRGPVLARRVAGRIVLGSGIATLIVAAAVVADIVSMLGNPGWTASAGSLAPPIEALVVATGAMTMLAGLLLTRASSVLRRPASVDLDTVTESDVVDDVLDLAVDVGARVRLGAWTRRASYMLEQFLDRSPISPRRHRVAFGVLLAIAGAVAFVVWHAIREGPWASPTAAIVFGMFPLVGILAIYLVTLAPLRLLRAAPD